MAYAPLFHELHSELFLALCHIINEIYAGAKLSRQDIFQRLPQMDWQGVQRVDELLNSMFTFAEDGCAQLFLSAPICFRPTQNELVWLKVMLEDTNAEFLLPENLRKKLLLRLQSVPSQELTSFWQVIQERGDDAETLQKKLAVIWQALREQKKLCYENKDRQGRLHQGICCPCRLEYDAAGNRYHLIVWQEREQRALKMKLSNLQNVECLPEDVPAETEVQFQNFLQEKRRCVTIRIVQKNNAVERCFLLFAPYDKEASYDETANIYMLKIYYYDFDRQEVLQQIISLGAAATVVEPEDMRTEIIRRLQGAWQFIHENQ